ncbi:MAG: polysaccharide biosynthesis tyrosine autokinase [Desulfocapsa sp.]|nr:polysaccharide biosynthesis tyrosine autokinase [Desulfocapsa sp.]MBN4064043.1 polysaccharide biosynthesis tyrosine autokinase [bacterium AH-315-I07]
MLKLKTTRKNMPGREAMLVNFSSKSGYAESYRTLRTNLSFSMMEKDLNSLVITSSLQGEGKTNTVANLAYTIAQTGKSVLMVDADLRKPGLSTRFGVQKVTGFSNIIADVLGRSVNSGLLEDYGLHDLILLSALQKRTNVLNIKNKQNEVELFFLKGELVDVYWKSRPDSKKLANTLVKEKLLTENEAEVALGHQKKSVRRLGAVLLSLMMIEEKVLNKILAVQVMEAFRIATEMEDGSFSVSSVADDEIQFSKSQSVNFSQLTRELVSSEKGNSYITKHIESNILSTEEKSLFLLPSGSIPPNPSELIGSNKTEYLLRILQKKFDVVIVDSSPIVPASDALLLSQHVDGVVLVIKAGETNRTIVKDAAQQLTTAGANILGVLLNSADMTKGSYYKYYQQYYGS